MVTTLGMYVYYCYYYYYSIRDALLWTKMPQYAFCLFVRSCVDGNDDESFISPECPKGGSMPLNVLYCEKRQ